jgi:hypothetical protein
MTVDRPAARAFGAMAQEYDRGRPGWMDEPTAVVAERRVERHGIGDVTQTYRAMITTAQRVDG